MKPVEFLVWLRDEVGVIRHSKEGNKLNLPSNGELRRWIKNGVLEVNDSVLSLEDRVVFPITKLVLFPTNSKSRVTLV